MAVGSVSYKSFHLFCLEKPEGEATITLSADILHYGDETQKLWKPLLTQFSLSEAYRNGLDKGIRWDIFSPPASPLNTRTISSASQQNLCNPLKM